MENIVVVKPCGSGKTRQACELAALLASQGKRVLYVVPTRALLLEVYEQIRAHGARVEISAGRSADRPPVNCRNPLADLSDAAGFSLLSFCQTCHFFNSCSYVEGRAALTIPGVVRVTTLAFLIWNRVPFGTADVVIYDEMPLWFEIPKRYLHLLPEPYRSAVVKFEDLPSPIRREARRYHARLGTEAPGGFLIPRLLAGRERTLILTATPIPGLIEAMVGGEVDYSAEGDFFGVDQRVRWFFCDLPHSREWSPQASGCGFKKNTRPGLPYFRASLGLGQWRGQALDVFGSYQPPWHVFAILAFLLQTPLKIDPVDVMFDHPPQEDPLGLGQRMRIPSWTLSFERDGKAIPIPWLLRAADLAQLLGRSGIGVENNYVGAIPLAARNTVWQYRLAREISLEGYSPRDVAREILMHFFLFHRQPLDAAVHAYPGLASLLDKRMVAAIRKRAARIRSFVEQFNSHILAKGN